jgi:hydroxymethylglutaryl-CoA reductase
MRLHARAVAVAAGASGARFDEVVEKLVADGEIKVWKARQIVANLEGVGVVASSDNVLPALSPHPVSKVDADRNVGYGKIILLGEHSVVYGRHAIAAPIGLTVRAEVSRGPSGQNPVITDWDVDGSVHEPISADISHRVAALIAERLGLPTSGVRVDVFSHLPRASGLGASAAFAVALIRATADCFDIALSDEEVSSLAFECEQIVHGTPSGIDNTVATFGRPILFRKTDAPAGHEIRDIFTPNPIPIVIGLTGVHSLTAHTVATVRAAWQKNPARYDAIFDQIDALVVDGVDALRRGDTTELGELMNINQGLLNALQVSSPELEQMVAIARRAGALGAKLTGGGGGGAMIALAGPAGTESLRTALRRAGYASFLTEIR